MYVSLEDFEQNVGKYMMLAKKVNTPGGNGQFDRTSPTLIPLKSYTLSAAPTPPV